MASEVSLTEHSALGGGSEASGGRTAAGRHDGGLGTFRVLGLLGFWVSGRFESLQWRVKLTRSRGLGALGLGLLRSFGLMVICIRELQHIGDPNIELEMV